MLLRLPDPDHRYAGVRLCSDLGGDGALARENGEWRLALDLPGVTRLEYEFEVSHADGRSERLCDPGNPRRAPGVFGEKSVLLAPGYAPPDWLEAPVVEGETSALTVHGRGLGADVHVAIWAPAGTPPDEPLPLLVAHDGPEYDELSRLTRYAAAQIAGGALPPHRVALLAPQDRDEWYSASARYAGALTRDVLPAIAGAVATKGEPAAIGASLGALALLHAHRRHPGAFGALFLQSGSFFVPRFDAHEARFPRYQRIVRFTRAMPRGAGDAPPVPTVLTCGAAEENVHNNRLTARTLAAQGYPARLHEVGDTHNHTAWRDALHPHLTGLLARAWA